MRTGTRRTKALTAALTTLALAAGALGYTHFFTRGIDRLPGRPCGGAVDRALVASALPSARTAEERGKLEQGLHGFTFQCYVHASGDSSLVGDAQTGKGNDPKAWYAHYLSKRRDDTPIEVSAGDIRALSLSPDLATVYVPCTPPRSRLPAENLIVEATTIGPTRAKGDELRQVVVDFAYQLLRHAYEAGGCKEARDFPDALPRLTEGRVVEEPIG
ncbi:hypothetical protein AB0A99_03040 [Streptomyces fradiae]|uniref:hypothetical protein n=1 Tax=Streptomyces fradiae TaxID=1906 RepID=UPI0034026525